MKTIYLARHAKSSWNSVAVSDFDRPLNRRGEADAVKMGEELKRLDWLPEKIIASPAIRAKQTCKSYCEILDYPVANVEWNSEIYAAHMITLLQLLLSLNESINSVMLIGHNPAMEDLLVHLCGYSKVSEQQQKDGKIFTTANVAKLSTNVEWKDLVMDEMSLDKMLRPKEI